MLNPILAFKPLAVKGLSLCNRYRGVPIAFASSMILSNQLNKRMDLDEGWSKSRMFSAILPYMLVGAAMAYHRATRKASAITMFVFGTTQNGIFYVERRKKQENVAKLFGRIRTGDFTSQPLVCNDILVNILFHLPPKKSQEFAIVNKQFLKAYLDMKMPMDKAFRMQWNFDVSVMYPTHGFKTLADVEDDTTSLKSQGYAPMMISMLKKKSFEELFTVSHEDEKIQALYETWMDECKESRSLLGVWSHAYRLFPIANRNYIQEIPSQLPTYRKASPIEFIACCLSNRFLATAGWKFIENENTTFIIVKVENSNITISTTQTLGAFDRMMVESFFDHLYLNRLLVKEV